MTRKDYELIAQAVDIITEKPIEMRTLAWIVKIFTNRLMIDNPNFDEDKFKKACGLKSI